MTHFTKVFSTVGTVLLFLLVWLILGLLMYFALVLLFNAPIEIVATKIFPTVISLVLTIFVHAFSYD